MNTIHRIKYFFAHRFVRDTAVLQVGTVLGTLTQAIAGVLIARLLKPELFGQYALAFSVASIATIFLGSGVQDAVAPYVARAWAGKDRSGLLQALGFWAKFTTANIVATCAIIFVLPWVTAFLYRSITIGEYAMVIVIASLISTTVFTLTQLTLQVAGRIRTLSLVTLGDTVIRHGVVIGLMLAGFGVWGAVNGHMVGAALFFLISAGLYTRLVRSYAILPKLSELCILVRSVTWRPLIGPTLWVMIDRNLAMLYGALPVAMVGLYATSSEVAYFKLAFGYIMLAMTVLGPISTLLNVSFPTMQVTNRAGLRRAFIRVTGYATLMTGVITLIVVVVSPWVFRLLYGEIYMPALDYVYGFVLLGALFGLGVGLGPMWRAIGRVHVSIMINLMILSIGIPLGMLLITHWHIWGAVAMVTLWYTASHLASFAYVLRALKGDVK